MRRTIAIDIDDTIAGTTDAIRLWGNQLAGVELSEAAYREAGEYWGYYERVWLKHDVAHVLQYDDFHELIARDMVEIPMLPSAEFAINELAKRNKIVLITSRSEDLEEATRRWIGRHFARHDIEIYFAKNHRYGEDTVRMSKGQICGQLGASILIDDNVEHCTSARDEGVEALLFGEYGWQNLNPEGVMRCRDWQAVLEYVNR